MKKNNTWNIRRLVDESFVPATQHILKIVGFQELLPGSTTIYFLLFVGRAKHNAYICQFANGDKYWRRSATGSSPYCYNTHSHKYSTST